MAMECVFLNLLVFIFVLISSLMDTFRVGSECECQRTEKRASIYETTKMKHIDVLYLQETHSLSEVEHFIDGRLLLMKARFDLFNAVFINLYAPTIVTERKLFLQKVNVLNGCATEDYLFLGGDFKMYRECGTRPQSCRAAYSFSTGLRQLVYFHGLVDVWRTHADCRQYTWSRLRESRISSARLDCIYCFKHHFNIF